MAKLSVLVLEKLRKTLVLLGEELRKELIKELLAQGHKATGDLIESVENKVAIKIKEIELSISYFKYGIYLERGIKPSEYRTSKPGRAEIKALLDWLLRKRIVAKLDAKARGFAFAIGYAHRKAGFPTRNARKFSPTGRVLAFQSLVLRRKRKDIETRLETEIEKTVTVTLDDIVYNITRKVA